MSIDAILVVLVILLLPLIERLAQWLRLRAAGRSSGDGRPSRPTADRPARPPRRTAPSQHRPRVEPLPEPVRPEREKPLAAPPSSQRPGRPAPERLTLRERALAAREATPLAPTEATERPPQRQRRMQTARLADGEVDYRRAMVLLTILGPCRANRPYEGPEGLQ